MEDRKCSNTTLLMEAIALMNDAQERLEKVQSGWSMTFSEMLYVQMAIDDLQEANRKVAHINKFLVPHGKNGSKPLSTHGVRFGRRCSSFYKPKAG